MSGESGWVGVPVVMSERSVVVVGFGTGQGRVVGHRTVSWGSIRNRMVSTERVRFRVT